MRVFVTGKHDLCQFKAGVFFFLSLTLILLTISSCGSQPNSPARILDRSDRVLANAARMGSLQQGKLPKGLPRNCRLWSDWSQMCSHLGGGQWFCAQSAVEAVEPSAPFCLNSLYGIDEAQFYHQQAFESYGRYCSQSTKAQDGDGYADGQTREYIGAPKRYCYLYQSNRPFNGKRVAERRHPWCDAWTDSGSKELVCSETANGTKSCENLASANFESSNRLVCSSWSLPTTSCDEAYDYYDLWEGPNESVQLENLGKEREYISFGIQLPPAVYGVECVLPIKKSGEINE